VFSLWHLPYRLFVDRMALGDAMFNILTGLLTSSLVLGLMFLVTKNIVTPAIVHTLMDWWEA